MILDYISSGTSGLKIFRRDTGLWDDLETRELKKVIKSLTEEKLKYSMLFNAYTEVGIGKAAKEFYEDKVNKIYADSGGLQIITLGRQVTEADKENIYELQGSLSHVAMCFDEIPITTRLKQGSSKLEITNMSARMFDPDKVKEKAIATGINVKNQIRKFREMGSSTKPMLILQGNSIDSFQEWIDYACDAIGSDLSEVCGISLAGTTLGGGSLENIVRIAAGTLCKYPKELNIENTHMLGVGTPIRLAPFVPLAHKMKKQYLSFDSTTHSHAVFKGTIILGGKAQKVSNLSPYEREEIVQNINTFLNGRCDYRISLEDFDDMFAGSLPYREKYGRLGAHCPKFILITGVVFAYMVYDCLLTVQKMFTDKITFHTMAKNYGGFGIYKTLGQCNDINDFKEWYNKNRQHFDSDKVDNIKESATLEAFF
ncbi:MAG: hypothetical protein ACXV2C_00150 [Candidatus Bathyarchaeia archaeon]